MTLHIAVIGNSHVGAIKSAWDKIEHKYPQIKLTFFAARSRNMEFVRIEKGKLVPYRSRTESSMEFTSGGKKVIDPDEYDAFLLYGLRARPYMPDLTQHFSEQAHAAALADLRKSQALLRLLKLTRRITKKPIFLGEHPLPIAHESASNKGRMYKEKGVHDYHFGASLSARFFKDQYNATLIMQPAETIERNQFTAEIYAKESERLQIGRENDTLVDGPEDLVHMNSEYGKLWLENLIPEALAIAQESQREVAATAQ